MAATGVQPILQAEWLSLGHEVYPDSLEATQCCMAPRSGPMGAQLYTAWSSAFQNYISTGSGPQHGRLTKPPVLQELLPRHRAVTEACMAALLALAQTNP